jgi:hypothetical protein
MRKKRNGAALIMALYLTVILAALGTFFIADQLNKSRTAINSVNSQLALQGANGVLNLIVNYFGNTANDWSDAITLANGAANPTPVCSAPASLQGLAYPMTINSVNLAQNVANTNPPMDENQYAFNFSGTIPIPNSGGKVLAVPNLSSSDQNEIDIFYDSPPGSPDKQIPCPNDPAYTGSEDAAVLQTVQIDVVAEVENSSGSVLAAREIRWTGARYNSSALNYPGASSWNGGPGGDPPNYAEGTETDAYIGNGETINGAIFSLANPNTSNNGTYGYLNNPSQSPYGTDTNGAVSIQNGIGGSPCNGCPTADPQLNGGVETYGSVTISGTGNPINGSESQNTGNTVPSPTGVPWGPAANSSGNPNLNTSPGNMLNAYDQASSEASKCGVSTIFITGSNNVGIGIPGSSTGYEIEAPPPGSQATKPGYAVTDITLNSNNTVSINRYGYYSGATLYSNSMTSSQLQCLSNNGGVLYVQGGNVRVHGNLSSVGLTIVANQGEEFYNSNHQVINAILPTTGIATDTTGYGSVTPSPVNAERFSSLAADNAPGNQVSYFIPQACGSSGQPGCSSSNFPQVSPTQSWNCPCTVNGRTVPGVDVDGTYYTSYSPPSGANGPAGSVVGYAIDNVNGKPVTLTGISCTGINQCAAPNGIGNSDETIFAPPPQYHPSTEEYTGITEPIQINGQWVFPYPGATGVTNLINGSATNGTTWAGTDVTDLFYSDQYQESEGNLTISGSVSDPLGLGLIAQNYILLNDFNAYNNYQDGNYNFNVQADLVSANQSVQWEALTQGDPTNPQQTFLNGDYAGWNGTGYASGANSQYGGLCGGQTGCTDLSPLFSQPPNKNKLNQYWNFNLTGTIYAPYQDVVNTINNNNNNDIGYAQEQVSPASMNQKPPLLPSVSTNFLDWQAGNFLDRYITLTYSDMGAYQAGR